MADTIFDTAWKTSEQIRDRAFSIDEFRMTPGMISNLANELSRQASDMRIAFGRANKMANLNKVRTKWRWKRFGEALHDLPQMTPNSFSIGLTWPCVTQISICDMKYRETLA